MDTKLLGQILASVATAAAVAGAITVNPLGVASNPEEISQIISGFLDIWLAHPASGNVPQHPTPAIQFQTGRASNAT